uniref:NADH-ubiquinone oxidoreductase chain 2 n=1 Tax=Sirembo imberbis TaxID=181399 RepID=Q8HMG8_SIRIM|nr:NADH dehydrogenase subunit 2 [Sirembo imberbis]BAC23191.1 NADH dehydrogenase subunit 2 [Sirembo imberbis]
MNVQMMFILLSSLMLGTTITCASSHWLYAWLGLEMNTLAMLPLIVRSQHPRAVEATVKYFITQITASAMIMMAVLTHVVLSGQWDMKDPHLTVSPVIILLALAMKVGIPPMHAWLPEVMQASDYKTAMLVMTWQKIAPVALMMQNRATPDNMYTALAMLSVLSAGWAGLNQTHLRKVLAYSSITHLGWTIVILRHSEYLALMNLYVYFIPTIPLLFIFMLMKSDRMGKVGISRHYGPIMTALSPLLLLALAGLPPFPIFYMKLYIIGEMIYQDIGVTATLIALASLLGLYFYARLAYTMSLTSWPNLSTAMANWRLRTKKVTIVLAVTAAAAILMLPLLPTQISFMMWYWSMR